MKKLFTIFLLSGLIFGLNSCGEGGASSKAYFVSIADADGNNVVADGSSCNFMGDGISGNVEFGFDNGKLSILDCWNKVDDGVSALKGQSFKGSVTVGEYTAEGVDITVTEVEDKSNGNYDIKGTIGGSSKGEFTVSAFKM